MVGAGVTTTEALKAFDTLSADGVNIRVVDIFCLKPIDKQLLIESANAAHKRVITVEDHYVEGMSDFTKSVLFSVFGRYMYHSNKLKQLPPDISRPAVLFASFAALWKAM